jgi:hypothetical protein
MVPFSRAQSQSIFLNLDKLWYLLVEHKVMAFLNCDQLWYLLVEPRVKAFLN